MKRFGFGMLLGIAVTVSLGATVSQIENVYGQLGSGRPSQYRANMITGLTTWKTGVTGAKSFLAEASVVATDHSDDALTTLVAGYDNELVSAFQASDIGGPAGLAQLVADFSEVAGREGTPTELRLQVGGVVLPVTQDQ